MNLRGLQVLIGTLGALLLVIALTRGLSPAAVWWALCGLGTVLFVETALIRQLLPHYRTTLHWTRVAHHLPGVRLIADSGQTPPRLRGTLDGCSVRIDQVAGGAKVTIRPVHRDQDADVQLSLRWANVQRGRWRTGDPSFDPLVEVQGGVPEGLLVLDESTRGRVLNALLDGITVDIDRVAWHGARSPSPIQVVHRLHVMADLTRRLFSVTPNELRARARRTIRNDPFPEVRARTLWLYQEHYALDADDEQVIRAALEDADARVRLAAAGALIGIEPRAAQAEAMLAEAIARGDSMAVPLGSAVTRLLEHGRPEVISAALQARLRDEGPLPPEIVRWALAQTRPPSAPILGARLLRAPGSDAADAVAELVASGSEQEPALIALLDHVRDAVVDRAVDGLAFSGTARAVPALRHLTRNLRRPRRLRHAAADALTAIQARAPRATRGQLSLIDPASAPGRLSLERPT